MKARRPAGKTKPDTPRPAPHPPGDAAAALPLAPAAAVRLVRLHDGAACGTGCAMLDSEAAWKAIAEGKEGDNERSEVIHALLSEDPETFMGWFRRMPRSMMPDGNPAWLLLAERHEKELLEIATELSRDPEG